VKPSTLSLNALHSMESGLVLILIRDLLAYNSGRISDIVWAILGSSWENTEYRSYTFEANDDMDASIRETAESRKRRGKTGTQLSTVEQWRLFDMAMQRDEDKREQARREREQAWGSWGRGW
jgi:hypothetical protein